MSRRVADTRTTTWREPAVIKLGEISKQGIPQGERARLLPWDFVLISSDLRDITDCPPDCQPDW